MMEFGKTLRAAREAKGYTTSQIADQTHMLVQIIEGLEHEDFSRIVAPIYGRGFVKLYCEAVGLDPRPMLEQFMKIYNGNRDAAPHEREDKDDSPEDANIEEKAPDPIPVEKPASEPPAVIVNESIADEPPPIMQTIGNASTANPPREQELNFNTPSRYAAPMPIDDDNRPRWLPKLPPNLWRIFFVLAVAVAIVYGLFVGAKALYRMTMSDPTAETAPEATPEMQENHASGVPADSAALPQETENPVSVKERKPLPVTPLYLD